VTKEELQTLAIEAAQLQRRALKLSRWAYYNETGAFEMRDAAACLREAATCLDAVSEAVLRASGRYPETAFRRKSPALARVA
jgi:hypothetical protein